MVIETALILAAGHGKRMKPLTEVIPKPMLPVYGIPFLERILFNLSGAGIRRVVVVVGYLREQIFSYFKEKKQRDMDIQFVIQQEPLGMAHAVKTARKLLEKEHDFLVCAADSLFSSNQVKHLIREHKRRHAFITLCLQKIKLNKPIDTALVRLENDGRISFIIEKPLLELAPSNIAARPIYVFNNEILDQVEHVERSSRGEYELQDAIQATIEMGKRVYGILINSFTTLNDIHDYLSANWFFLNKIGHSIQGKLAKDARIITPSLICQDSIIESGCVVGPYGYIETGVTLEAGVSVKNTIILSGVKVGKNAKLVNSVVGPNTVVPSGAQIGYEGTNTIVCFPTTCNT